MKKFSTDIHGKIEYTPFYLKIRADIQQQLNDHLCAADEGQNYDEETDGLFVSGKEECAMQIAQHIFLSIKDAWKDGWRVRNESCGLSKSQILIKKKDQWNRLKEALLNE